MLSLRVSLDFIVLLRLVILASNVSFSDFKSLSFLVISSLLTNLSIALEFASLNLIEFKRDSLSEFNLHNLPSNSLSSLSRFISKSSFRVLILCISVSISLNLRVY